MTERPSIELDRSVEPGDYFAWVSSPESSGLVPATIGEDGCVTVDGEACERFDLSLCFPVGRDGDMRYLLSIGPSDSERREAFVGLLEQLASARDPGPLHYALAESALKNPSITELTSELDAESNNLFRRAIAGSLCDALNGLHDRLAPDLPTMNREWSDLLRKHGGETDTADFWDAAADARMAKPSPAERWQSWIDLRKRPSGSPALQLAALAIAKRLLRGFSEYLARKARLPAPSLLHPVAQSISLVAASASAHTIPSGAVEFSDTDGSWAQRVTASAMIQVAQKVSSGGGKRLVAPVAAFLARQVWRQWSLGQQPYNVVTLPASKTGAAQALGVAVRDSNDLVAALDWLGQLSANGHGALNGWHAAKLAPAGQKGGRPAECFIIEVGTPLAPFALEKLYRDHGRRLPIEFYVPVFDLAKVPTGGNRRTLATAYAAGAMGLGAVLMVRRDDYAREGIRLDRSFKDELSAMGLWSRRHPNLVDDTLKAWTTPPDPTLWCPLLAPVEPGSDRFRLGPHFEAEHRMILAAADLSKGKRSKRAKKGT